MKKTALLLILTYVIHYSFAQSYSLELDSTYGTNGWTLTVVNGDAQLSDQHAMVLDSTQRLIMAGDYSINQLNHAFSIVRLRPDGIADTSFNHTGIDTLNLSPTEDELYAVEVQKDQKIVVGGFNSSNFIATAARYLTNGRLDTSFGPGGVITMGGNGINCIRMRADQHILAGVSRLVYCLKPDGHADSTFGVNGIVNVSAHSFGGANAIQVQKDGKIVLTGATMSFPSDWAAVRLNHNGSLDSTFGVNGYAIFSVPRGGGISWGSGIDSNGNILLCGTANTQCAAARLKPNGSVDSTFADNGRFVYSDSTSQAVFYSVAVRPDGKAVFFGDSMGWKVIIARFNADGRIDSSFAGCGVITAPFIPTLDLTRGMILPDGKMIIAAHGGGINNTYGMVAARFLAEPVFHPAAVTSVEETNAINPLRVYPVPAQNSVNVSIADISHADEIELINSTGQMIRQIKVRQNITTIDCSDLAKSIYLVKLKNEDGTYQIRKIEIR